MDKWQEYTRRGITEFQLKYHGNAILLHHQALETARHEFSREVCLSPERAIQKVLISCFNLADCYIALDEIDRAADFYLAAQAFLSDAWDVSAPENDLASAIDHGLHHLCMMWAEYLKNHRGKISSWKLLQYHTTLQVLHKQELQIQVCH